MAFTFDARAALIAAQNRRRTPAIVATVATPRPVQAKTVATIATIAGPDAAKTRRAPDRDAFEERAAIAEFDGGLSREVAERLAAQEQGFDDAAAFFAACKEED